MKRKLELERLANACTLAVVEGDEKKLRGLLREMQDVLDPPRTKDALIGGIKLVGGSDVEVESETGVTLILQCSDANGAAAMRDALRRHALNFATRCD